MPLPNPQNTAQTPTSKPSATTPPKISTPLCPKPTRKP
ncbi:hypothetical protein HHE014_06840 [Helicobacter heilmannii]|nr:hypothetical protein HHE014_06840 [Helicobacter heilmannii]